VNIRKLAVHAKYAVHAKLAVHAKFAEELHAKNTKTAVFRRGSTDN